MEDQLHGCFAFGRNSKRDAIITPKAKTRRIPFDLFRQVRVRVENGFPQRNDSIFQGMVEVVEERLHRYRSFGHEAW